MIEIRHLPDAAEAAPMLRVLRDSLDDATFATRLTAAVAQGYTTLGAYEGARMVGVLGYRITYDLCWGQTLYVDDLVVDPATRGTGVGKRLLDEARAIAAQSCDSMRLCSGLSRHDAHRFYETNGMTRSSLQFVERLKG